MTRTFISLADDAAINAFYEKYKDPRLATVKKNEKVPNVGDVVCLNDEGLEQVFGKTHGLSFMKKLEMKITWVADESATFPEPTFQVEVDNPEINEFLLTHHCFNIQRR